MIVHEKKKLRMLISAIFACLRLAAIKIGMTLMTASKIHNSLLITAPDRLRLPKMPGGCGTK